MAIGDEQQWIETYVFCVGVKETHSLSGVLLALVRFYTLGQSSAASRIRITIRNVKVHYYYIATTTQYASISMHVGDGGE